MFSCTFLLVKLAHCKIICKCHKQIFQAPRHLWGRPSWWGKDDNCIRVFFTAHGLVTRHFSEGLVKFVRDGFKLFFLVDQFIWKKIILEYCIVMSIILLEKTAQFFNKICLKAQKECVQVQNCAVVSREWIF